MSRFTEDFQNLIIGGAISHPKEFTPYGSLIIPRHFVGLHATLAARVLNDYHVKYGTFPSWIIFEQLMTRRMTRLQSEDSGGDVGQVLDFVREIRSAAKENIRSPSDIENVTGQIVEFSRHQAMVAAIKKNIELVKDGQELDLRVCEEALDVGRSVDKLGVLLSPHAPELMDDVIDRVTSSTFGIRTGYPLLDEIWINGWGPGWLIVPVAPPKRYKSTFCLNLALNIAGPSQGHDVLYYSCEISEDLAAIRSMINFTGLNEKVVYRETAKFKEEVRRSVSMALSGEILLTGFAAGTASIADLKAHARMVVNQGLKPKAIFIDYADTIRRDDSKRDKQKADHLQQADVYTQARQFGSEFGCPVIMPDRITREAVSKKVPDMQSFQGAYAKGGIVDVALGLCADDTEYLNNVIRAFVFVNRHGAAFQHIEGRVEPDLYRISLDKRIAYDPDDNDAQPTKKGRGKDSNGPRAMSDHDFA